MAQAVTKLALAVSSMSQGTTLSADVVATSPGTPPVVGSVDFYEDNARRHGNRLERCRDRDDRDVVPGRTSFQAIFKGNANFSSSSSRVDGGPASEASPPLWVPRPEDVPDHRFQRPLDPTSAQDIANYTIAGPINGQGHSSHRIKVGMAIYDSATDSVTLVPTARLNIHREYTLTINGTTPSGVANPSGLLLDGAGNGKPGSNYRTLLTWRNLAGTGQQSADHRPGGCGPFTKAVAKTSTQRAHTTLHAAAVDHLLE